MRIHFASQRRDMYIDSTEVESVMSYEGIERRLSPRGKGPFEETVKSEIWLLDGAKFYSSLEDKVILRILQMRKGPRKIYVEPVGK